MYDLTTSLMEFLNARAGERPFVQRESLTHRQRRQIVRPRHGLRYPRASFHRRGRDPGCPPEAPGWLLPHQ